MAVTVSAIAGASLIRNSLGTSQVARDQIIKERSRLQAIIDTPMTPVSDAAAVDTRARRDTAKVVARADCAPVKTKDLDVCARSKAALGQAEAALQRANEKHDADVRAAEQQHRVDVANAETVLKALPAISADQDIVAAAFATVLPWMPEAWVSRIVVLLWVGLFTCAPCVLLRLGLALIAATRTTSQSPQG